jgi:hypothetical protein
MLSLVITPVVVLKVFMKSSEKLKGFYYLFLPDDSKSISIYCGGKLAVLNLPSFSYSQFAFQFPAPLSL